MLISHSYFPWDILFVVSARGGGGSGKRGGRETQRSPPQLTVHMYILSMLLCCRFFSSSKFYIIVCCKKNTRININRTGEKYQQRGNNTPTTDRRRKNCVYEAAPDSWQSAPGRGRQHTRKKREEKVAGGRATTTTTNTNADSSNDISENLSRVVVILESGPGTTSARHGEWYINTTSAYAVAHHKSSLSSSCRIVVVGVLVLLLSLSLKNARLWWVLYRSLSRSLCIICWSLLLPPPPLGHRSEEQQKEKRARDIFENVYIFYDVASSEKAQKSENKC